MAGAFLNLPNFVFEIALFSSQPKLQLLKVELVKCNGHANKEPWSSLPPFYGFHCAFVDFKRLCYSCDKDSLVINGPIYPQIFVKCCDLKLILDHAKLVNLFSYHYLTKVLDHIAWVWVVKRDISVSTTN